MHELKDDIPREIVVFQTRARKCVNKYFQNVVPLLINTILALEDCSMKSGKMNFKGK